MERPRFEQPLTDAQFEASGRDMRLLEAHISRGADPLNRTPPMPDPPISDVLPPQPAAAEAPPPPPANDETFREVLRTLVAAALAPTGQDLQSTLQTTAPPVNDVQLHAYMKQLYAAKPAHIAAVLNQADASLRIKHHVDMMQMGEKAAQDFTALTVPAALMSWLGTFGAGALAAQPESDTLGTRDAMTKNLKTVESVCQLVSPKTSAQALSKTASKSAVPTWAIVVIALLAVLVVILVVLLAVKSGRRTKTVASLGGGGHENSVLTDWNWNTRA